MVIFEDILRNNKNIFFLWLVAFSLPNLYAQSTLLIQLEKTTEQKWDAKKPFEFGFSGLDSLNNYFGVTGVKRIKTSKNSFSQDIFILSLDSTLTDTSVLFLYKNLPEIKHVEWDEIVQGSGAPQKITSMPDDEHYDRQWGLKNTGQADIPNAVAGIDIKMEDAWNITTGDSAIIIAFLDTGIKTNHPEFAGRLWQNKREIPGNGIDDDDNGYIDDVFGLNIFQGNGNVMDDNGHGTNVAGIAAANGNNAIGFAGVDWYCKILTIKCLNNQNSGTISGLIEGIYYAVDNGARVINMSLGTAGNSRFLYEALDYAWHNGVLPVAAMMNFDNDQTYFPAAYQNTLAVGAISADGTRSAPFCWGGGSNFGWHIDVSAPGNYMYGLSHTSNTNFNKFWCGTSQATPIVAGLAALMLAVDNSLSPGEIRSVLRQTSIDRTGRPTEDAYGFDMYHGYGLVNALAALQFVANRQEIKKVQIYPNPVGNILTIIWGMPGSAEIELITLQGQIAASVPIYWGANSFDVSALNNGMYILRIDGQFVQKIVVVK